MNIKVVKPKGIPRDLKALFEQVVNSNELMYQIGEMIRKDIVNKTRSGYSIPMDGSFDNVGERWQNSRRSLANYNNLHPAARISGARSNLTFTGQLMDSLGFEHMGGGLLNYKFYFMHKGYRTILGKEKDVPNAEIAKELADKGRPMLGLSAEARDRAKRMVIQYLRRGLMVYNSK